MSKQRAPKREPGKLPEWNFLSFETAFGAVALLFVAAAPVVVAVKIILAKTAPRRAARRNGATT